LHKILKKEKQYRKKLALRKKTSLAQRKQLEEAKKISTSKRKLPTPEWNFKMSLWKWMLIFTAATTMD